jgi:hypothetical protein
MSGFESNQRINQALLVLTRTLQPYVEREMRRVYKANWQQNLSVASGGDRSKPLDAYGLLKTMMDNWQSVFRDALKPTVRNFVSLAFAARNDANHASGALSNMDAVAYLRGILGVVEAVDAKSAAGIKALMDDQIKATAADLGVSPEVAAQTIAKPQQNLDLGDGKYAWKPWRDVAPPHQDVMSARFVEAEFAADLATVARGEASETYQDPREFYRITFMTGGMRQVLQRAVERLAGKGSDPVIGLQTSFGGGKTHTLLALYHLASAQKPETLPGLADIFKAAGVTALPIKSKPVVFVGTAAGANQPFRVEGNKTVKSLWGLIAVKLGGWKAYEAIKASDEARTNPGSEALIPILKQAAPCLILLDEVVAYARNLDGLAYDGFVSFFQSLTEAATAVPGVLVVGSLPESGAEVGNERGRQALLQLEKIFGRVQSAWAPAQGTETFEIIRRRLFQELDDEGQKAREQAIKAFASYYRNNAGEFPAEVREKAYEEQLRAAYPVHPELFDMLQTDWGGLEKFQKTRGVLKMMAQIVFRLWRDEHAAPMILPGHVPLTDHKVRSNALFPLPTGYDAVIAKEIAGDLAKPAQIEARSPSVGKNKAVTRSATAVFVGTAPYGATNNKGLEVARLRLACAVPGEQPAQFSDALRRMQQDGAAYLYAEGDRYWFSTEPTLNQLAEERAAAWPAPEVEAEITALLRAEEGKAQRGSGFLRVHGAPDDLLGIEDAYEAALVILPPSHPHIGRSKETAATKLAADVLEHKGAGHRRNRNRLAFLAADEGALADVRSIVRKKLAWASIVRDADTLQLPPNPQRDAEKKRNENALAAENAVRRCWKHLLLPQAAEPGSPNAARGFDMEPVTLAAKANDPAPLAQLAWSKCEQDGLIVSTLGVLDNDLAKVWQLPDQPHIAVRQLRDWFAQLPYLSKLREPSVLAKALAEAVGRGDARYAIADGFDAAKSEYAGLKLGRLVEVRLDSDMLLVQRAVADAQIAKGEPAGSTPQPASGAGSAPWPQPSPQDPHSPGGAPTPTNGSAAPRPRRFYAKVVLDPSRPTPMVSQIAQSILSELDRVRGTTITITLDIDAETPVGFPKDVEEVVRDNARTLKITEFDFEKE